MVVFLCSNTESHNIIVSYITVYTQKERERKKEMYNILYICAYVPMSV